MAKQVGDYTYSTEEIKKALAKSKGAVYRAAKSLGCTASAIYGRIKAEPELKEIIDDLRGLKVDLAEDQLDKAVKKGEPWAITFTLKTIGKDRGYTERTEITGADGSPIEITTIEVIKPDGVE